MFAKNAQKHFQKEANDNILLVKSMPTDKDVMEMKTVIWDEERTSQQ